MQPQQSDFFSNGPIRPNIPLTGNYDAIHKGSEVIMRKSNEVDGPFDDYIQGVTDDPFSHRQRQPTFPQVYNGFKDGSNANVAAAHVKAFKQRVNMAKDKVDAGRLCSNCSVT